MIVVMLFLFILWYASEGPYAYFLFYDTDLKSHILHGQLLLQLVIFTSLSRTLKSLHPAQVRGSEEHNDH